MPIHDFNRVDPGIFHDFYQAWTIELRNALNGGVLPAGYFAMAEQFIGGPIPDVVTLQRGDDAASDPRPTGGLAVADAPPTARYVAVAETDLYVARANRVVVRHRLGEVVAVVEIVSPGNKQSVFALRTLVEKAAELLRGGMNLLLVDLLPPTPRDPQGIHKALWDQFCDEPFCLPPGKPLTVAAYAADEPKKAYVEPVAVGDPLPALPLFLDPRTYVPAPLEPSYQAAWQTEPQVVRDLVAGPSD